MPGYLIKTPFFTASIENDEELVQLASVDTVKKDTMIRVLPGKEWIEAAQLPLLRKIWGIDTDVVVPPVALSEHHSIPSINTFSVTNQIKPVDTLSKPGAKLPPRLETTIDINPLFRELYVEPEDALTGLLDEGEHVEASAGDKANSPEAEVSAENSPEAEASAENLPEADASAENLPEAETSSENAPEAEASAENAPDAEVSAENAPDAEASAENAPEAEA
ncbi:MAG: hypothetical protein II767_06750, partial [Proteobacteria bacterium]|nr:hypothetical protein [Pseudomonadota bacterium]